MLSDPATMKKPTRNRSSVASPVTQLEAELLKLRGELRETLRVYSVRLEMQLAEAVNALRAAKSVEELPRDHLHQLRDLTTLVRKRKVKPEKGRRKDLRVIDTLISDVHTFLPAERPREPRSALAARDLRRDEPDQTAVDCGAVCEIDAGDSAFAEAHIATGQCADHGREIGLVTDEHQVTAFRALQERAQFRGM